MKRILACMMVAAAVLVAAGCGRKYWEPTADHIGQAEKVARYFVLREISDQAGTPAAQDLKLDAAGLPVEYPIAFTVKGTPYSRYRQKFWGGMLKGAKLVHVQYFDPNLVPDWEKSKEATGVFPGYFSIAVDIEKGAATRDP